MSKMKGVGAKKRRSGKRKRKLDGGHATKKEQTQGMESSKATTETTKATVTSISREGRRRLGRKKTKKNNSKNKYAQINNDISVRLKDETERDEGRIGKSGNGNGEGGEGEGEGKERRRREKKRRGKKRKLNMNDGQIECEREKLVPDVEESMEMTKKKVKVDMNDPENIKLRSESLNSRMMERLRASQFRFLSETLYKTSGKEALDLFSNDPSKFSFYHDGYKSQIAKWPVNPLQLIIADIKSRPKNLIVADFGCGEAKLAENVPHLVHSFDLIAANQRVTVCDIAKVPLNSESIDIAVFCLSLMGINFVDYIVEAHRVLKFGGILKIAEIESRFKSLDKFVKDLTFLGFKLLKKDVSHKMFVIFDFLKCKGFNRKKIPRLKLNPCLYKKR